MMTDVAASPLRVGLIGLGRSGLHLIERFAAGGPFRVVAVFDATPGFAISDVVSQFRVPCAPSVEELLSTAEIDVVWFASQEAFRGDFAAAGGSYGKHTIGETPFTLSLTVAETAFEQADKNGRLLLVHHPRRSDPEFRQALSVAQDQSVGPIRSAKFVSWTYGIPPRGATRGTGPLPPDGVDDTQVTKVRFVAHALDQLVLLIGDRPLRVFAAGDPNAPGFPDLFAGLSLSLQIHFEHGCQAEIDVRLDSPTPFQSGWMLTAERGGYSKGRRFTLADDGEIFDSPVPLAVDSQDADQFERLAQQIRSGQRDPVEEARVRTVVALLDGAQRSLASKQAVDL